MRLQLQRRPMEMYLKILAKPLLTEQVKDFNISDRNEVKYGSPLVPKKSW